MLPHGEGRWSAAFLWISTCCGKEQICSHRHGTGHCIGRMRTTFVLDPHRRHDRKRASGSERPRIPANGRAGGLTTQSMQDLLVFGWVVSFVEPPVSLKASERIDTLTRAPTNPCAEPALRVAYLKLPAYAVGHLAAS